MNLSEIIELPYGIRITLQGGGVGEIVSQLKECEDESDRVEEYEAAVDGLESLLLAMAVKGIDLRDPRVAEAVAETVETISNQFL